MVRRVIDHVLKLRPEGELQKLSLLVAELEDPLQIFRRQPVEEGPLLEVTEHPADDRVAELLA